MRLLLPGDSGLPAGSELDLERLARCYETPATWFRCNMVTTLDGAANGPDGLTGTINTDADHAVFDLLRALAHAVVVGAGTVRAEGYGSLVVDAGLSAVREVVGLPEVCPLVVITRSGDVPPTLRDCEPGAVLLCTCAESPGLDQARAELGEDHVLVCGRDEVDLGELVAALHSRGLTRLLTEGGPHLTGSLLGAGLLDELCFTVSPKAVGGRHPRPVGPAATPVDLELKLLIEQDGSLMGRWLVPRGSGLTRAHSRAAVEDAPPQVAPGPREGSPATNDETTDSHRSGS